MLSTSQSVPGFVLPPLDPGGPTPSRWGPPPPGPGASVSYEKGGWAPGPEERERVWRRGVSEEQVAARHEVTALKRQVAECVAAVRGWEARFETNEAVAAEQQEVLRQLQHRLRLDFAALAETVREQPT